MVEITTREESGHVIGDRRYRSDVGQGSIAKFNLEAQIIVNSPFLVMMVSKIGRRGAWRHTEQ